MDDENSDGGSDSGDGSPKANNKGLKSKVSFTICHLYFNCSNKFQRALRDKKKGAKGQQDMAGHGLEYKNYSD